MLAWLQQWYWREPLWLCLALQPFLLMALRNLWRRQRLRRYAEPDLQAWVIQTEHKSLLQRMVSRDTAYVLAWLLLAIAVAGPRLPSPTTATKQVAGINLMIVVDNSRSMTVNDVLPSRIRRARLEIEELLAQAAGNRIGIITYAAHPHLYAPLTSDYVALRSYLSILDDLVLPTQGSLVASALALAYRELASVSGPRAVLLVTDGDVGEINAQQHQQLLDAASQLADNNIPLYVLGTGSIEGDAIPLTGGGWLTVNARPVISRLNEELLKALAETGNGRYSVAYDDNSDWQSLYTQGMATLIRPGAVEEDEELQWQEFYGWFLLPGMLLLYLSLYPYRWPPRNLITPPATLLALGLVMIFARGQANAAEPDRIEQRAYLLYQQEEYGNSAREYAQLDSFAARLGEGASQYRQGDYTAAIQQYSSAVLRAETDADRAAALYNLGNSYFRIGDYETAIQVYRDALHYRPAYANAQQNLDFSLAVQEELNKRLRESVIAERAGGGPRSARATADVEVSASGRLALDDSQNSKEAPLPPAVPGGIDRSTLEALIQRGLEHVQVAGGIATGIKPSTRVLPDTGLTDMRMQLQTLQNKQARLWKRIFELEEGYPAELDTPQPVNGVSPW